MIHYYVHRSQLLVPILSQTTPIHAFPSCIFQKRSNAILPSVHISLRWSPPFRFLHHTPKCTSLLPTHVTVLITLIFQWLWTTKVISISFSPASCHSSLLHPNTLLSTTHLNTLRLPTCLNLKDQVSQPNKIRKIIVCFNFYILRQLWIEW